MAFREKDEFVKEAAVKELIDGWQSEDVNEFVKKLISRPVL
jgi:hypothetical protein